MSFSTLELESDPHPNKDQHFSFRYTVFKVYVDIQKQHLIAKTGMKTIVVPLPKLKYFFHHIPIGQDQIELVLAYQSKDKLKRARLFSDLQQEEFDALLEFIQAQCPYGSLTHLPASEAYQVMGSRELSWIVIPSIMSLAILLVALCGLPLLIHGMDRGHATLLAQDVYQNPALVNTLDTHNITIDAQADMTHSWRILEQQGQKLLYELVFPLYPSQITVTEDVVARIFLKVRGRGELPIKEFSNQKSFRGIMRTIAWEGLGDHTRKSLVKSGLKIAPQPILIEYQAKNKSDLSIYIIILGALSTLTLLVTFYLKPTKVK